MNIPKIIEKITQFILHFDLAKFFQEFKVVILILALLSLIIIAFGAVLGQLF